MFAFVKRRWQRVKTSGVFKVDESCAHSPTRKAPAADELERAGRNLERLDVVRELAETGKGFYDHPGPAALTIEHAAIGHLDGTPGVLIYDLEHGGADFVADLGGGLLGMVATVVRNVALRVLMDRAEGRVEPW